MIRRRGFTLIEVLIALTLLSMIMVATISALRAFGNTKTAITLVTNRVDEIRVVSEFLRDAIGGAMPVLRVGTVDEAFSGASNYGTYFAGGVSEMTWVAPLLAGADLGGAFVMRLAHVDEKLELKWYPYKKGAEALDWNQIEPRILLHAVEELEIGYLPVYGSEWVDTWRGALGNPVAVRLNVKSGERYWPELVVRLGAGDLNMR